MKWFYVIIGIWLGMGLSPGNRGTLVHEPSYTYLNFESGIEDFVVLRNTSLHVMAKRYSGSSDYVWLERQLLDLERTTFQTRNYAAKYPLELVGLSVKGVIQEEGELKYLVVLEEATNVLKVLTLKVVYTSSTPTNLNYRYIIDQSKEIPKNSTLDSEIHVTYADYEDQGSIVGRRIIIAGTAAGDKHIFLAVFNTRMNVTEFLYEEPASVEERVKAVKITENAPLILVISERKSNFPIEPNINNVPDSTNAEPKVAVRAFSLERQGLEWSTIIGHSGFNDHFLSAGLCGNFLIVAYNTSSSPQSSTYTPVVCDVEFAVIRYETGEGIKQGSEMVLSNIAGPTNLLDLAVTHGSGIYALVSVTAGETKYIKNAAQIYTFASNSYALFLFELDLATSPSLPQLKLLDVEALTHDGLKAHPATKIQLYYPSGYEEYGFPEILLLGHLSNSDKTGLHFFSFDDRSGTSVLHNPFVTNSCTAPCKYCLAADSAKCLQCVDTSVYYLSNMATCAATCTTGFFLYEGKKCLKCHYSCETCKGPLRTDCLTCDISRTHSTVTGRCTCKAANPYEISGACTTSCSSGQAGYHTNSYCLDKCPSYRFHYVDYATTDSILSTAGLPVTSSGTDKLEFAPSPNACLELPGPTDVTSLPNEFTLSLWAYVTSAAPASPQTLIWGFNSFSLKVSAANKVSFVFHPSIGTDITATSGAADVATGAWQFIGASMRKNATGYDMLLYMSTSGPGAEVGSVTSAGTVEFPTYINKLLVGCTGTYDASSPNIWFSGYIRELVFQSKFHDTVSLESGKTRVYSKYTELYYGVLSYWRFDKITAVTEGMLIEDSSKYGLKKTITTAPGNPRKAGATEGATCTSKWNNFGECIDIFEYLNFQKFTLDRKGYIVNGIQYRINSIPKAFRNTMLRTGDKVLFTYRGCDSTPILELGVQQLSDSTIKLEEGKELPVTVVGTYVDVCYYSTLLSYKIRMGQVYFPQIPTHIYQSHGTTDLTYSTSLTFTLSGGDQTIGDKITLVNMEKFVEEVQEDVFMIDESSSTRTIYSMKKTGKNTFSNIDGSKIDAGIYVVGWRPYYATSKNELSLIEYNNMFTTWSFQEIPRARFAEMSGMSGVYENSARFKAQLLYMDLVGPGQSDGDEILFCYTGCHYSNRRGNPFVRTHGSYPPVWFGQATGVSDLTQNLVFDRVYVCWRPAARAATVSAEDDLWSSVYMYSLSSTKAYIRIYSLSANQHLPEILETNPPLSSPILVSGEYISFTISECYTSSEKVKPTSYNSVPGKVQLLHKIYTVLNHTSYKTEVIWEQEFTQVADSGISGYTVGKLHGDSSTGKFTLLNVPQSKMVAGHEYILVIYSRSFKCLNTNAYLFGNIDSGAAQFKFEFSYQELPVKSSQTTVLSTTTELVFTSSNIGDETITDGGFEEVRHLYAINSTLFCGSTFIPSSYKIYSLKNDNPQEIRISGLDLSACSGTLNVSLKLYKVVEYSGELIWTYYGTREPISLEISSCHSSCKTCNGSTQVDCLTCNIHSKNRYLYKGQCLTKCTGDLPYSEIVWVPSTYTISYYKCVSQCREGYFLNKQTNQCFQCNDQCRTCTSGDTMSCLSCKGTAIAVDGASINYNNTYNETYSFKKMCMFECPSLLNDLSAAGNELIHYENYTRTCLMDSLPQNSAPLTIKIQPVVYPQRVSIKKSIQLRALIDDPTSSLKTLYWESHPAEDKTVTDFYTSDERIFNEYTEENLNKSITALNMNSFNYKGENDQMRVYIKGYTADSMGYDIIELYGNRPPELDNNYITFSQTENLKTFQTLNITIKNILDSDDVYEVLKFRILLITRSLTIPDGVSSSLSTSSLVLLAQLTETTKTIYGSKQLYPVDEKITLTDIFIPPLIEGVQAISSDVNSSAVTCDLYVVVEDRHLGISKAKFIRNITEIYAVENRTSTLKDLQQVLASNTMDWDLALRVGHTFLVANPSKVTYYMTPNLCTRDSQCSGNGKCMPSSGSSKCLCNEGYAGSECEWTQTELAAAQEITNTVLAFLYESLVQPKISDPSFQSSDTNELDELANILLGLLKNPEVGSTKMHTFYVFELCKYLTNIDNKVGGRLEKYEIINILTALNAAYKFLFFQMRSAIFDIIVYSEKREDSTSTIEAEFMELRESLTFNFTNMTKGFYHFIDALSTGQYPGEDPFYKKFSTFEVFFVAARESSLFENFDQQFGLQLPSGAYIKIPPTVFDSVRTKVSKDEEFKIRVVIWTENPYVFSDYQSGVVTNLMSLAILDSDGTQLSFSMTEPIVLFLPLSNVTRNFQSEFVRCKGFSHTNKLNITRKHTEKINVNLLMATDAEKRRRFPEWDPSLFQSTNLISDEVTYETQECTYPEFVESELLSSYGNLFKIGEYQSYIPCACYDMYEVAGIVERKKAKEMAVPVTGFYHSFDPLTNWPYSLLFYYCIGIYTLFIICYILSYLGDKILLPRIEKIVELHRLEYSEKDVEMNYFQKGDDTIGHPIHMKKLSMDDSSEIDKSNFTMKFESTENDKKEDSFKGTNTLVLGETTQAHIKGEDESAGDIPKDRDSMGSGRNENEIKPEEANRSPTNPEEMHTNIAMRTHVNPTGQEEDNEPDKMFSYIQAAEIRKKEKLERKVEDIFSEEYILRKEAEQFSILNCFINGNILLNTITRSNSLYTRPTRCILLFIQIFFYLFWSSVLISGQMEALDHPEKRKEISNIITENLWMPVIIPIFISFIMYIFAGMFKLREAKIFACKSMSQYRRIRNEVLKERVVRRVIGLVLSTVSVIGMTVYMVRFSATYGWKVSTECVWCSFLSIIVDMGIYDGLLSLFLSFSYQRMKSFALWMQSWRVFKQAEIQE